MKHYIVSSLLFFCLISYGASQLGKMQKYAVKGKLMCGNKPADTSFVRLIENTLGVEQTMAEVMSESDGTFYIEGKEREVSRIDPSLSIYHYCDDNYPCRRRWTMFLPKTYIMKEGDDPKGRTYDIGVVNLEIRWRQEFRSCLN